MSLLKVILDGKHLTFLASLLHLEAADFDPEFIGLRAENHLTTFDQLVRSPRITKYAVEQKARRIRIAFSSLADYHRKENRSAYVIASAAVDDEIRRGITELQSIRSVTADLDKQIDAILHDESISEEDLRALVSTLPQVLKTQGMLFASVRSHFEKAMTEVGKELDQMWDADRYVRSAPGEVIE